MTQACFKLENINVEVKSIKGKCKACFCVGDNFSLETIIPKGLCPFLYHTALPYLAAIENGAVFNLLEKNFMIAQCPNPKVGVAVKIQEGKEKEIKISVVDPHTKKSSCSYYHFESGNNWVVPRGKNFFCRRAFDSIFPYLNALSAQVRACAKGEHISIMTCSAYPDFVTFRLTAL